MSRKAEAGETLMAAPRHIACIDAGTTGCRTIVFSLEGLAVSHAYEEYSSIFLSPTWIEHDPTTWINAARNTLGRALDALPKNERQTIAIAVTSQRATLTPVDRQGAPLDRAISWQDMRAAGEATMIREKAGPDFVYRKTGLRIDPYFSLPKLLWLKQNKPALFRDAHKFLAVHDLIVHFLIGRFVTEWTQASRTMLFNIGTFRWDEELCDRFGIPLELLPQAVQPGTVVGELRTSLRDELGITGDVPVVAVGGDQQAAAVGLGVVASGLVGVNSGTGSFVLAHSDQPAFDEEQRVICTPSPVAGKWIVEGSVITSGCVYRWFRDNLAVVVTDEEIERVEAGAQGVMLIPHFAGSAAPYWDRDASGILFGLALGHTRSHIARAVLEGICFEICKSLHIIESLTGEISEVRVSGGAAKSELFNQIQADVYGRPVLRTVCQESSALGAMIVAAAAVGLYSDVPAAVDAIAALDTAARKTPDPRLCAVYRRLLALHDEIYQALRSRDIYEKARELRTEERKPPC